MDELQQLNGLDNARSVLDAHIVNLMTFIHRLDEIKFHRRKKEHFKTCVADMDDTTKWLLTFSTWFCMFNARFRKVEPTRYYSVPLSKSNATTFSEFVEVLRHYEYVRVTGRREGRLSEFFSRCDELHKEFYLRLVSHDFVKSLPMMEAQELLDIDGIDFASIYRAKVEILATPLGELEYPVIIRAVPDDEMKLCALVKRAHASSYKEFKDDWHHLPVPVELRRDINFSKWPTFVLVGYVNETGMYPIDMFQRAADHVAHIKGEGPPLTERIALLNESLTTELFTFVDTGKVVVVDTPDALSKALLDIMGLSVESTILIANSDTSKGLEAHSLKPRLTHGVVDSLWVEDGIAKGFYTWFNGSLVQVSFDFSGRNNALLNCHAEASKRIIKFLYFNVGGDDQYIGKEIVWNSRTWRYKPLRGSGIYIEKCAMCGSTKHPHVNRGLCKSCEILVGYYFNTRPKNEWFVPAYVMQRKRHEGCWEPELLNAVRYRYKGYLVKANYDGDWGFFEDEESRRLYESWLSKQ